MRNRDLKRPVQLKTERVTCPACFGMEEDEPCDACHGRGYFLRESGKESRDEPEAVCVES